MSTAQMLMAYGAAAPPPPPTDPNYANVVLLLPFNGTNGGTTTTDFSPSPASLTFRNGAALSSTQAKFGATSLSLDGTNDDLLSNRVQNIGAGLFTMESHVRPTGAQTGRVVSAQDSGATNAVVCYRIDSDGTVTYIHRSSAGTGTVVLSSASGLIAMNDSAWFHVAVTRNGSNRIDIWVDGVSVANTTSGTNPTNIAPYIVGSQYGLAEFFKGYIDNVRITEGVCRYTGTFTPPTAEYPTS